MGRNRLHRRDRTPEKNVPVATEEREREILWRQYQLHIDLYKFYLDLTVKVVVFYYAVTGGILSFVFTRRDVLIAKWAVALPCILSLALALLFLYGAKLLDVTREDVFHLRDRLGLETAPELAVLQVMLRLFACVMVATGLALAVLLVMQ
jgi:hypothetical protein